MANKIDEVRARLQAEAREISAHEDAPEGGGDRPKPRGFRNKGMKRVLVTVLLLIIVGSCWLAYSMYRDFTAGTRLPARDPETGLRAPVSTEKAKERLLEGLKKAQSLPQGKAGGVKPPAPAKTPAAKPAPPQ